MKKSGLNRLSKIGVILGAICLLSLPVFSGGLSAETPKLSPQSGQTVQGKTVRLATAADEILPMKQSAQAVQGKIVGNKLMLIDQRGRQTLARDGIYTVQGGAKIRVENGQIIDIDGKVTDKSGIIGIIDIDN